ncbi:MAG: TIGR01212 family radical SAM protein [Deltaproteobacteria bacterium]|nr:TIGR01212 family radical SAM protein [Deltaproteobacteria bacterium]
MKKPYLDLNSYFRSVFGCRVQKIAVDASMNCPNRDGTLSTGGCIYCNERGSGTGAHAAGLSVKDQLLAGKAALFRRYKAKKFIAYFQSYSNTYAPLSRLRGLYDESLAVSDIVGLSIGTRPDCVDDKKLDLLKEYAQNNMVWVEYGLQSANDETLARINRGHDLNCFLQAVSDTRKRGVLTCAHVILGLPGETRADMLHTADVLARTGIDGVKLHFMYVVRGTVLDKWYGSGRYGCLSREEYVDAVCEFIARLPDTVVIQRLIGDPHKDELVAPAWALEKAKIFELIKKKFVEKGLCQGQYAPPELNIKKHPGRSKKIGPGA